MSFQMGVYLILMSSQCVTATEMGPLDGISLRYSLTVFMKRIWKVLYDENPTKNLAFSPLLIQIYLTMYAVGATSTTQTELYLGLAYRNETFPKTEEFFKQFFLNLPSSLHPLADITTIAKVVGQPLKREIVSMLPSFEAVTETYEKGIDMQNANKFIKSFTNDKVRSLLKHTLHSSYSALLNALRMTAYWLRKFKPKDTDADYFYRHGTDDTEVDMMKMHGRFEFSKLEKLNAVAVVLPLANDKMKLMIVLPNQRQGLADLANKMLQINYKFSEMKLEMTDIDLSVPRLTIYHNVDIKPEILEKIGLNEPFSNNAKFAGLFDEQLFGKLKDILQTIVLEIDESTINISSGTFIDIVKRPKRSTSARVVVDHPFMFICYMDTITFFAGHINDVSW